ncbi:MAG: hypothetical protein QXJ75_05650 [Candidatus Bathyarchaeia archaeon]
MREKTVEIEGQRFTIKRFTLGEKGEIYDKAAETDAQGRTRIRTRELMIYTLVYGVKEPKLTPEAASALDANIGERLFAEVTAFNGVPLPKPNAF